MPIESFTDKDNEITKALLEYMKKKKGKKKVRLIDMLNDN